MLVDKVLVKKIAGLAKLKFKEEELGVVSAQLSSILEHMKALDNVKIDGVNPMFHGCIEDAPLAKDEREVLDPKDITATTPYVKDNFFCVPSILEEQN